jgi:prefoldin subunit 5
VRRNVSILNECLLTVQEVCKTLLDSITKLMGIVERHSQRITKLEEQFRLYEQRFEGSGHLRDQHGGPGPTYRG